MEIENINQNLENPLNIAIIEDGPDTIKTLSQYFDSRNPVIQCVMAVDSVQKFIKFYREFLDIKLVLLDLQLGDELCIPYIPLIRERLPECPIIIYSLFDDSNIIFQALRHGANGYLLKDIPVIELEKELLACLQENKPLLSPAIAHKILKHFSAPDSNLNITEDEALTKIEKIVMGHLIDGLKYAEIASNMNITIDGVRYHIKNIYKKLQINSRVELMKRSKWGL